MKSDRDQSIERLLRALPRSGGGTLHDGSCPDAETLAALADNTLLPAVRREIETHVADCDRCQMLTVALVRSERLAAATAEEPARVQSWKRRAINWLVPAAAAATAVALWVIVPGQRTAVVPDGPELDQKIAALPPVAAPNAPTDAARQAPVDALRDQSAATSAETRANRAVPAEVAQQLPNDLSRRQVIGQPALKAEESRSREAESGGPAREAAPATVAGDLQVSGQSARNDAGRREAIQETVTVEESGRSAPTSPAASSAGFQARVASGSFEVVSPNPPVRWRIGPGSVVQHSANGGMTWATQQTGATADLTAGSSPSTDVCWLVGRAGLVLRTTDSGRQWERAPFPETVDITAVTASSAVNATVTSADGRRFQTTDGGRTWAPAQ
jgi:hypothetical protein